MISEDRKVCTKCHVLKPFSDFCRDRANKTGHHTRCKSCEIVRVAEWRRANPEWSPPYSRERLMNRYGITLAIYDEMFETQNGCCAICGESCMTGQALSVDHDHKTGEVRGLLCKRCNFGIGYLRDSPELLKAAAEYLS